MNPVKYTLLVVDEYKDLEKCKNESYGWQNSIVNPCKPSNALRNALAVGCGILFLSAYAFSKSPLDFRASHSPRRGDIHLPALPTYQLDSELINHLGPYGPRHAVPSKISSETPKGCDVSMISILQRHGARYPTGDGEGARIDTALGKLSQVTNVTDPSLEFVLDFKYPYIADQLVPLGQKQMYVSGQIIAQKYASLGSSAFVRSSKEERIAESAGWWEQGFRGDSFDVPVSELPYPAVAIPVSDVRSVAYYRVYVLTRFIVQKMNNTLDVQTCPAARALNPPLGDTASAQWLATFAPPITKRLNDGLPGANLTDRDVFSLMNLCGFDSAAKNGTASPWCGVFSMDEWKGYEYYHDLEKYWSKSYGSVYARSLGAGWVNELLSRLTGQPVQDTTSTNSTLDSNHESFPIGPSAPKIFADFSSDNNIATILSSLGILRDSVPLPSTGPIPSDASQQFVVSKMVPFGGLTLVEKLSCSGSELHGDYVRIIINDAVISMDTLPECEGSESINGLCALDKFVQSQAYARAGGNFTSCFETN
ncbi:histidine acid phosphatase [Rhizoctonia solani 123E]|uniref:Histidine acid phosphatase n=1 Tax=Rhizoctonia solani 123E TaxID=1423351 RepID=A0A074RXC5_9AGAM|nr:histidine acid phosphatase [Rhizoctonia solani 123E]